MIDFLKCNWLDLSLVIVGTSALFVYWFQKRSEKKAAATKVLLQIDQIEYIISELKSKRTLDNVSVYKIPTILAHNSWEESGYQFYGSMGRDDLKLIDDFFSCAAELEKSRAAICHSMTKAWEDKDAEVQAKIAEIIYKNGNESNLEIQSFISAFEPNPHIFMANLPIEILVTNLSKFRHITGTTAYKQLQKISYRK